MRLEDAAAAAPPMPTCAGCSCFRADVLDVETDEGPRPLCWLCRHAVVEHGVKLARIGCVPPERATYRDENGDLRQRLDEYTVCLHRREAIYPASVVKARDEYRAAREAQTEAALASAWPRWLRDVEAAPAPEAAAA